MHFSGSVVISDNADSEKTLKYLRSGVIITPIQVTSMIVNAHLRENLS